MPATAARCLAGRLTRQAEVIVDRTVEVELLALLKNHQRRRAVNDLLVEAA